MICGDIRNRLDGVVGKAGNTLDWDFSNRAEPVETAVTPSAASASAATAASAAGTSACCRASLAFKHRVTAAAGAAERTRRWCAPVLCGFATVKYGVLHFVAFHILSLTNKHLIT